MIFCLSAPDKSFQNPALPSDGEGGGGSPSLGPASKPCSADKRGFRAGGPSCHNPEVKLISLPLKIWEGGMLQLLGKAHGSQDLLNPNPLRHQVCLNSSESYLIIQAQQQRRRGVVAGSPQSKINGFLTQKCSVASTTPVWAVTLVLPSPEQPFPHGWGPSKWYHPHQLLLGGYFCCLQKEKEKTQEGKIPNPLVTVGTMASSSSLISPGCSCNPALHPSNPSPAQLPRTCYLL